VSCGLVAAVGLPGALLMLIAMIFWSKEARVPTKFLPSLVITFTILSIIFSTYCDIDY
jgi:hypothetical protein